MSFVLKITDEHGYPYGIFINKKGKYSNSKIIYIISSRLIMDSPHSIKKIEEDEEPIWMKNEGTMDNYKTNSDSENKSGN